MVQRVQGATHDAGGTLDVDCTRSDLPSPTILDGGLSDHRLLRWSSHLCRPATVYTTSIRRCWRSFDLDTFQADLLASALCDVQSYSDLDSDSLASLYDSTITELLDRQVPLLSVTCGRRPSSLWFDDECRGAKRKVRRLERAARREGPLALSMSPTAAAWRAERRAYLLRQATTTAKQRTYWTERVDADQSLPCRLWWSFYELLGHGRPRPPDIDATAIHRYLDDKVIGVRTATSGADPPFFTLCPTGCSPRDFYPVTPADVKTLVRSLPNKQCYSDPQPKANADILSPFLCQLFNSCLMHGTVPSSFKSGYVTPLLKKADLDAADVKSYRPITNLSVVSKLLERLVAQQLTTFLTDNGLQSTYRAHHSTETAMLNEDRW